MLSVDLHVHSLFSCCGLHTIIELLDRAKTLGMKGIAITDHGLALGGRLSHPFYERFKSPYPEIKIYKGIECNILEKNGSIDMPEGYLQYIDIVLTGIHPNIPSGQSCQYYTDMLIAAITKNPSVDCITHPNDRTYPVDYPRLCACAAQHGVALELNNSRILYNRSTVGETLTFLEQCKQSKCQVIVASDTHAIQELGGDDDVAPLLRQVSFPDELLVTLNVERVETFIMERKQHKMV